MVLWSIWFKRRVLKTLLFIFNNIPKLTSYNRLKGRMDTITQIVTMKKKCFIPFFTKLTNRFLITTELKGGLYETILVDLLNKHSSIQEYKIVTKIEKEAVKNQLHFVSSLLSIQSGNKEFNLKNLKMYLSTF